MVVKEINEKYKCSICGNEIMVIKVGGGTLVCCGENMEMTSGKESSALEEGFEVNGEDNEEKEDYEKDEEEET
ncbi:hypothetical protein A3K64_03890 [Candidatus Micrarchaeota archaeon RBG_16_36_9]|nr:MAG: hypothetical protein A3K64_03890 [Candidatus Micrarchaeota archaeon RBG_16_36_9]